MDVTPTEADILLSLLLVGDSLPITIANASGRHPRSVSRSVPKLVDQGLVVQKDRSVYALTPIGYARARGLLDEIAESDREI